MQILDNLQMHYTLKLYETDKVVETSIGQDPFPFQLGKEHSVIAGWNMGIPGMCLGEKRRLTIPYRFAYGERGNLPGMIWFLTCFPDLW